MSALPIVERLNDEAMRLQGRGIDRGCVDSSLSGNLALEAAALIDGLYEAAETLLSFWEQEPNGAVTVRAAIRLGAALAKARGQ